jgi:hypothetical protein
MVDWMGKNLVERKEQQWGKRMVGRLVVSLERKLVEWMAGKLAVWLVERMVVHSVERKAELLVASWVEQMEVRKVVDWAVLSVGRSDNHRVAWTAETLVAKMALLEQTLA